jgi:type 1 glutamine amidotransferase
MKNFLYFIAFVCLLNTTLFAQSPMEGKHVLIVYGGWKGHQPEVFAKKMAAWLKAQNAHVILSESTASYTDMELMQAQDLIIQHITMSQMSARESKGLRDAIARGVGLAGCHGGLGDSFRNDTEYQYMVGGQFVKHPGGQIDYEVSISDTNDPITQGIDDFSLKTEQYYMHYDPQIEILATTTFSGAHDAWIEGVSMPVVWKKSYGKGRVFYSALGHSADVFEIPEAWSMMTRGVEWAVK